MIETGRCKQTPRDKRLCPVCDSRLLKSKMKFTFSAFTKNILHLEMTFYLSSTSLFPQFPVVTLIGTGDYKTDARWGQTLKSVKFRDLFLLLSFHVLTKLAR